MNPTGRYWIILSVLVVAAVALHALSHGEPVAPLRALSSIPLRIDAWSGQDVKLEDRFVRALGVDDFLYRTYRQNDGAVVGLYIGFYATQRTGSTIHSPKNCLPGAGWQPVHSSTIALRRPDGTKATANLYIVQKGLQKQIVIYWYQSHGRVIASEYWGKFYLVADAIRLNRTDAAVVRIMTPLEGNDQEAHARAVGFAQQIVGVVDAFVPR